MVRAWYHDGSDADQRLQHRSDNSPLVGLDYLKEQGVLYWQLNADNYEEEGVLSRICKERGYDYEDVITCTPSTLPNYEEKLKIFFEEHLHDDEEIRFILDGSGYFDIRDKSDKWIRIEVVKGDLVVLPAGIYHRFTLDSKDYIKAKRLFIGQPVWTPFNRPADDHPARKSYVEKFLAANE